jgi:hypothetical protein
MTARLLTIGEKAEARAVFGEALNLDRVRVHARPRFFFQPKGTAMSPNGHVYYHARDCRADFACGPAPMAWLIHELAHVWQHQTGQWVLLRGMVERRYDYGRLTMASRFADFGLEQQASIVEDYYRQTMGLAPRHGEGALAAYKRLVPRK